MGTVETKCKTMRQWIDERNANKAVGLQTTLRDQEIIALGREILVEATGEDTIDATLRYMGEGFFDSSMW